MIRSYSPRSSPSAIDGARTCNASREPSERVRDLNTHNYTLVVRVLVRWEGEGTRIVNASCANSTIAYAHQCMLANRSYGVDHGTIMYCNTTGTSDESVEATMVHETLHILVFDLTVHQRVEQECEEIMDCKNRIWKNDTRSVLNKTGDPVEKYSYLATIDELRDAARAYFDCPHAQGLELRAKWSDESQRFEPDFGHWSARLFPDELMSPKSHVSQRLSNLTLSVLAAYRDWYRVDMSKAEPLFHKITAGCDQLEIGCHGIVAEKRRGEQPTSFQPYCDSMEQQGRAITSHCSSDHKVQLRCYRLADAMNACSSLIASSEMYDHEVCEKATKFKRDVAEDIGASFGLDTICVTLTSTPSYWKWPHYSTPICVLYEGVRNEKKLVLKLQPKGVLGSTCFVNCSADDSSRIVAGPKDASCGNATSISLICPDYRTICDPPATTTSPTTTDAPTQNTGESTRDRGATLPSSTLSPIADSCAIRSIVDWSRTVWTVLFWGLIVWFA